MTDVYVDVIGDYLVDGVAEVLPGAADLEVDVASSVDLVGSYVLSWW